MDDERASIAAILGEREREREWGGKPRKRMK